MLALLLSFAHAGEDAFGGLTIGAPVDISRWPVATDGYAYQPMTFAGISGIGTAQGFCGKALSLLNFRAFWTNAPTDGTVPIARSSDPRAASAVARGQVQRALVADGWAEVGSAPMRSDPTAIGTGYYKAGHARTLTVTCAEPGVPGKLMCQLQLAIGVDYTAACISHKL